MDEKSLKTSWWQRVIIIAVAILLLGSTMFAYLFIVMNSEGSNASDPDKEIAEITAKYDEKTAELDELAKPLSDQYFENFKSYKSNIKAYNAANANASGLVTTDLKEGTGKTLTEGDTDYYAYYVGWCPDGSVFGSSFDSYDEPTRLKAPIDPSMGLIEGWNQGVIGMKLGGVRQLSINGDLAYGDTREICEGYGSPLRFIIQVIEKDEAIEKVNAELDDLYMQLYYAYYGDGLSY